MKRGYLSGHFIGVVAKRLTAVEVMPSSSNQHEFNGVREFRVLFGRERITDCVTRFLWISDEEDCLTEQGFMTWYDARERHPTRSEYRLYFKPNAVMRAAQAGDFLLLARQQDDSVLAVIAPGGSTVEAQLLWLFDVPIRDSRELLFRDLSDNERMLGFAERYILEELGIETEDESETMLDEILDNLGFDFPNTATFSKIARNTLPEVNPVDDPDAALIAWIEREEALFRRQEKRVVGSRLTQGFVMDGDPDVDGFVSFSLSVHNRRKSRAGYALEHHLREIFDRFGIRYSHGGTTEGRKRPDFIFPGVLEYHDPEYPAGSLLMLGVKSTCKDRWRQVLSEAARIPDKHLLTLEPAISREQTREMQESRLQLVIPAALHATYREEQRGWLMGLGEFLEQLPRGGAPLIG